MRDNSSPWPFNLTEHRVIAINSHPMTACIYDVVSDWGKYKYIYIQTTLGDLVTLVRGESLCPDGRAAKFRSATTTRMNNKPE